MGNWWQVEVIHLFLSFFGTHKVAFPSADDGLIFVWSLNNGSLLQKISPKQGPVSVLRWFCNNQDSDSQCIISGGADGTIQLWERPHQRVSSVSVFHYI
jgi:WD40 repeat protein